MITGSTKSYLIKILSGFIINPLQFFKEIVGVTGLRKVEIYYYMLYTN